MVWMVAMVWAVEEEVYMMTVVMMTFSCFHNSMGDYNIDRSMGGSNLNCSSKNKEGINHNRDYSSINYNFPRGPFLLLS